MHRYNEPPDPVTTTTTNQATTMVRPTTTALVTHCDKFGSTYSSGSCQTTDSGYLSSLSSSFLSSTNLEASLTSNKVSNVPRHRDVDEERTPYDKNSSSTSSCMCDSGLDLPDTFSTLSIGGSKDRCSGGIEELPPSISNENDEVKWEEAYQQDQDGDTHLHLAIIQGDLDVVHALIKLAPYFGYLNIHNHLCQAPLHLAVLTGQSQIVRLLLEAGANSRIRDRFGNTPLHIACERGDYECVVELTRTFFPMPHLSSVVALRSDVEARNNDGIRSIHLAAIKGHIHILWRLKECGAHINAPEGKSGRTALHLAVEHHQFHLIEFLVQKCYANVNALTYAGVTPVQLAYGLNHGITEKLYNLGAVRNDRWINSDSETDSDSSYDESMETEVNHYQDLKINGKPLW